ncbi:MAG: phosphoadenosine phosphosulfate reductase family protein [Flavobacteriaceae bacterium]|nr:phosphoadenosine phosphosulfate reductase family protein [Flavobacteriaceae bacterium]
MKIMSNINHVLGISGGKDSAALAIYMSNKYPSLDINFYTCDTGKELKETYDLIDRLNSVLGRPITLFKSVDQENTPIDNPFDHFLATSGGFLPSPMARWCTKKMKLEPFEKQIGDSPTISYVGIRGDENREGYISKRDNIQTIFPFRKNIWSEDVISKFIANDNIPSLIEYYKLIGKYMSRDLIEKISTPVTFSYTKSQKVESLLNHDVKLFNKVVFEYLKTTNYPIGKLDHFPLIENDEIIILEDVFDILESSGVGIPAYYLPIEFEVEIDGKIEKGTYSRTRSGCFFCFFQQNIEWVWLLEQHPNLFDQAMKYEKEGYTWTLEPLAELKKPERVKEIKKEFILRMKREEEKKKKLVNWQDEILNAEGEGCASCFI